MPWRYPRWLAPSLLAGALGAWFGAACGETDEIRPKSILPADYRSTFVRVAACRLSIEHGSRYVAIWVSPAAEAAYRDGPYPLPDGTVVVKEQFGDDETCRTATEWTVMRKERGFAPERGDWRWQELDSVLGVRLDGVVASCVGCHAAYAATDYTALADR